MRTYSFLGPHLLFIEDRLPVDKTLLVESLDLTRSWTRSAGYLSNLIRIVWMDLVGNRILR